MLADPETRETRDTREAAMDESDISTLAKRKLYAIKLGEYERSIMNVYNSKTVT